MKYLITGATGFVGQYMTRHILQENPQAQILGISRSEADSEPSENIQIKNVDLNNAPAIQATLEDFAPDYIVHLAAQSSVGYSWTQPQQSFSNNVNIYLNLIEAVRVSKVQCRILSVGSSESYGSVRKDQTPLHENSDLNPISPYAVARVAQEMLSKVYIEGYGLDIVSTRSFNHFGPGQDNRFVIPSFIQRIKDRQASNSTEPVEVGDLSIVRDFVDVRDVVRAYYLLLHSPYSKEIYNICSGRATSLRQIFNKAKELIGYDVQTVTNPDFVRPNDNPYILGSYTKIKNDLDWEPEFNWERTLEDTIAGVALS